MSYPGARGPIVIPIPMSHLNVNSSNMDTTVVGPPTCLRIMLSTPGWNFYKQTILPYIFQGYNVKLKIQNTRTLPTSDTDTFKCTTHDFVTQGDSGGGTSGNFGMYITFGVRNDSANNLFRFREKMYTENGIDYSHYSYVIYP